MNRSLLYALRSLSFVICHLSFGLIGFAQAPDTTGQGMPKLDIPEITIVGKKAITLPFARKGEVFDVKLFQPPAPDSSLLGERLSSSLPVGTMPKEDERIQPLHASAEGAFGSFSTGKLNAFLDYRKGGWNFSGHSGFASTEGHMDNAKASSFAADVNAQTLLLTDNDALKNLQLSLGTSLLTETYGMFAYPDVERSRQNFQLMSSLGTLDRRGLTLDLALNTNVWNVKDKLPALEEEITAVSPTLTAAFATTVGKFRWTNDLSFSSISLDYSMPTQSVTLFHFTSSVRWNISSSWTTTLGVLFADGSDVLGTSRSLLLPTATLEWNIKQEQQLRFWWKPEMRLTSYDEQVRMNPYLLREIGLQPERTPVNVGATFSTSQNVYSVEAGISFALTSNKAITLADSGRVWLDFVEATQTKFELRGQLKPSESFRLHASGIVQPTFESGSSGQLPMIPLVKFQAKGEYDLKQPLTLWASLDYQSVRNADSAATRQLDGALLLGIGASTTLVPRTSLSLSVNNLLDTKYDWWYWYAAPGIQFSLEAKVNLR
ncbi:MAG: TonB-dependent receptor [Ignavibacteriae bacterium]|nr:TonB-dependent receptor [Ignavibacteriota bacterium]